eukprot:801436-Rhodomonas_salina.2
MVLRDRVVVGGRGIETSKIHPVSQPPPPPPPPPLGTSTTNALQYVSVSAWQTRIHEYYDIDLSIHTPTSILAKTWRYA